MSAEGADAIVTRDANSFNGLAVPKYTPGEFIAARGFDPIDL